MIGLKDTTKVELIDIHVTNEKTMTFKDVTVRLKFNEENKLNVKKRFYERVCSEYRIAGHNIAKIKNFENFLLSDDVGEKVFGDNNLGVVVRVKKELENFNLSIFD